MPNVPPDGWESEIRSARDGIEQTRADARAAQTTAEAARTEATAAKAAVAELGGRVGQPGAANLTRQVEDLRAALDALTVRVESLEGAAVVE